jgi:hypothetical protein
MLGSPERPGVLGAESTPGAMAEDRLEARDRLGLAADHQAEAAPEAPDAAARADVEVVDALSRSAAACAEVVVVVRVAAVDHASPGSSTSATASMVFACDLPAGTMTHTARGFSSFWASSSSDEAPSAPSATSASTASGWMS